MKIKLWNYQFGSAMNAVIDSSFIGVTTEPKKDHTGKYHVKSQCNRLDQ